MKPRYSPGSRTIVWCVVLAAASAACSAAGGGTSSAAAGSGGEDTGGGSGGTGATTTTGGTSTVGTGGVGLVGTGGTAPMGGGGGSIPTGGSGAGPSTGGTPPYGGYDPNVTFDWPETTPSAGSCKAGSYEGTFAGNYLSPAAFIIPAAITGSITLRLEQSAAGEFFEVRDGRVEGAANAGGLSVPYSADLVGELDCATGQLVNAELQNGTYTIGLTVYSFAGPMTASYDKLANQFVNGTWTVGEPTYTQPPPLYGGNGTWGAVWSAP